MKKRPDGTFQYSGMLDCLMKTAKNEGIRGFWAGLPTYYFRVGPHAMITLIASEWLKRKMLSTHQ